MNNDKPNQRSFIGLFLSSTNDSTAFQRWALKLITLAPLSISDFLHILCPCWLSASGSTTSVTQSDRHDWRVGAPKPAIGVAEIEDFINAYEIARGRSFTGQEHQTIGAAIVYTAAYGLRCAHAMRETDYGHYERAVRQLHELVECFLAA